MECEIKMALAYSKHLFLKILNNNSQKLCFPLLGTNHQFLFSVVQYSSDYGSSNQKMSNAMKSYLERVKKHDEFMEEQLKEFNIGKKHLANMMGKRGNDMTQKEIDEAIEYLFPSGLTIRSAKPMMKPPSEIYSIKKSAEFDFTGRPHHFLFYTAKPNFSQLLHDAAKHLEEINLYQCKMQKAGADTPTKVLNLVGGSWLTKEQLEKKLIERLYTIDYDKFIEVFERIASHPYNYLIEDFIKSYRISSASEKKADIQTPSVDKDGVLYVNIPSAGRKTARANVTVKYPGEGKVTINGTGIDYFLDIQSREQILFPLIFTEMEGRVNVEATVTGEGETSQAGAIRLGIALALQSFVPSDMLLKMKIAGLLQRDFRRRERKKPGQEGARRRYTWLKR